MKRKLLAWISSCIILGSTVPLAGAAARSIPVTVDGALLSESCYLENGMTTVPLRSLCQRLGNWSVAWDSNASCAMAVNENWTVAANPNEDLLTINGTVYSVPSGVTLRSGRTYIPLRTVCEALGLSVTWNSALGGASVSTGAATTYSEEDLYWLSRIISAESQGEPLLGQLAVGNVVLNRVASVEFPNTIKAVIFDTKDGTQFEPVSNQTVYNTPTAQSVAAAKAVLSGSESVVGSALYFYAPALSQGTWIRNNRTYYTTIGCHRFYL